MKCSSLADFNGSLGNEVRKGQIQGCLRVVGRGKVSQFLEALARPHVLDTAMDEGYRAMGNDLQREAEASEWINGLIGDGANAAR